MSLPSRILISISGIYRKRVTSFVSHPSTVKKEIKKERKIPNGFCNLLAAFIPHEESK